MDDHTTQQPSVKLCECGCGQPTTILFGKSRRFLQGHATRIRPLNKANPNPSGFCMCGCGEKTALVDGVFRKYLPSHHMRLRMLDPEQRFWARVNKNGPVHPVLGTACWLWEGNKGRGGYGRFALERGE